MKLDKWLARQGLSHTTFAHQIGVSQQMVSYWIGGRNKPNLKAMAAIEKATEGQVTMHDFLRTAQRASA